MKIYKTIFLFFFLWAGVCNAQESVLIVKPDTFAGSNTALQLGDAGQWLFKAGNDTTLAASNADISAWKKLAPGGLSADYADKSGRVECWFRLKVKIDSAFGQEHFGLGYFSWGAADIYIDGKLVYQNGKAGQSRATFRESRTIQALPIPVDLNAGRVHTLAIHFVDYVSPFPPRRLMSEDFPRRFLISLNTSKHDQLIYNYGLTLNTYNVIWVSVCTILSVLFWLLALQNRADRNILLIAACSSSYALTFIFVMATHLYGLSYTWYYWFNFFENVVSSVIFITVPLIIAGIFKRRVTGALKLFLWVIFIFSIAGYFAPVTLNVLLSGIFAIGVVIICIYYIISSWKNLRGAQWAIVTGLLVSLGMVLWAFAQVLSISNTADHNPDSYYYAMTGFSLSLPLSMMVYVALRFKEIIAEVRLNAAQVVKLSEEKKLEALNRQQILEAEVNRQTAELRTALEDLKSTQTQLIQSEKMASLGELTAGIAHEIQNPLNFVNNFSEVNTELIDELQLEIEKGDLEEVKAIAFDIGENEKKINMHGKRAGAIVKGMLQHSQSSSSKKEPTDINALADEYLRLSYHGMLGKDTGFSAELIAGFDPTLPKINVVQQDIGRVLLNLFNNAFYAVNQKKTTAGADYKPEVTVSTSTENGHVIIKVKDNGVGIPDAIKDKIMQPFFTTKPTGEGTGLGLSLTYDMVVKGHSGTIQVNSIEGEGAEFIISLPG